MLLTLRSPAGVSSRLGVDLLSLVVIEPAETNHVESVLLQQGRGTRGTSSAVSNR